MSHNRNPNPTTRAMRVYGWHFGLSVLVYFIVIAVIAVLVPLHAMTKPWRILVVLLPLIPVISAVVACIRFLRATDELRRQIFFTGLAIAGGVNIFFNIACWLLAIAGIPNPSSYCTFCVFIGSWTIASLFLERHYKLTYRDQ